MAILAYLGIDYLNWLVPKFAQKSRQADAILIKITGLKTDAITSSLFQGF